MNTVELDLLREQERMESQETREEWIDEQTEILVGNWEVNLEKEGIILDMDMEEGDILLLAKEQNLSRDDCLYGLARGYVERNEDEFLIEPDYSALEWD